MGMGKTPLPVPGGFHVLSLSDSHMSICVTCRELFLANTVSLVLELTVTVWPAAVVLCQQFAQLGLQSAEEQRDRVALLTMLLKHEVERLQVPRQPRLPAAPVLSLRSRSGLP